RCGRPLATTRPAALHAGAWEPRRPPQTPWGWWRPGARRGPPRRSRQPPEGETSSPIRGSALSFLGPSKDHPAGNRLQDAGHHHVGGFPDVLLPALDDHHGPVVEIAHALAGLLAVLDDLHRQLFARQDDRPQGLRRSEEHTSELQSRSDLVCRLLLEKKKNKT